MIELIYYPIHIPFNKQYLIRKKISIPNKTMIKDILNRFYAKGFATWVDDKLGGKVVENYKSNGHLDNKGKYFILSKDIRKTIMALDAL